MAPQTDIPVAANVLGLIPQIWTNWRTKKTDGLPALMMYLWAVCGVPFGAYAIIQNFNMPIQVQPQVFMALCLVSWAQILHYNKKVATWKATLAAVLMGAAFGGIEAGLIVGLRPRYHRGEEGPTIAVGIVASILLGSGLIPPYFEIYKRRGRVVGINFVFLSMDWLGAFFSLMALVAQNTFDVLGGVIYIICAFLEIGIFSSHAIWLLRTRTLRKQAKDEGKTFDELVAERVAVEGDAFPFAERTVPKYLSLTWWTAAINRTVLRRSLAKPSDEEDSSYTETPTPATGPAAKIETTEAPTHAAGSEKTEAKT